METQYGQQDHRRRHQDMERSFEVVGQQFGRHASPFRRRRMKPDPDEAERGDREHGRSHVEGHQGGEHRRQFRQDQAAGDVARPEPEQAGRFDMGTGKKRTGRGAGDTEIFDPLGQRQT